jgi:flagellar basal-body rod protein FlgC
MFRTLDISASGLQAQRTRMDVIAGNIAHAQTTVNEDGKPGPFQRRIVVLAAQPDAPRNEGGGQGVQAEIGIDANNPPRKVFSPGHPHADSNGYVNYPNINIITEFVNALEASRAYEANLTAMDVTKDMVQNTFRILA